VDIKFTTSIEDYVNFNLYEFHTKPAYRRQQGQSRLYSTLLITFCGLLITYAAGNPWIFPGILITLLVSAVYFIFFKRNDERNLVNRLRKGLMHSDNDGLYGEERVTISPEKVTNEMPYGELNISWKHVKKVVENEGYIYIYYAAERALFIPKRAFTGEEQQSKFVELVNRYWKEQGIPEDNY
jgi:hypothetical protein